MIRWIRQATDDVNARDIAQRQRQETTGVHPIPDTSDVLLACTAYLIAAPIVLVLTLVFLLSLWSFGWYNVLVVMGIMWLPHVQFIMGISLFYAPTMCCQTIFGVSENQVTPLDPAS